MDVNMVDVKNKKFLNDGQAANKSSLRVLTDNEIEEVSGGLVFLGLTGGAWLAIDLFGGGFAVGAYWAYNS